MSANKITTFSPKIAHLRMGGPIADTPAKIPKEGRPGPGRPRGSPNKISRTMKEALISAVETLGSTDLDKWSEIVKKAQDDPDPYRRFFTIAAVKDLKTFMAVVARIIPTHVIQPKERRYITEEQARAELKAAGVPESVLGFLPSYDGRQYDPEEIVGGRNPYEDDDDMRCDTAKARSR
jgi:hypothetical protein